MSDLTKFLGGFGETFFSSLENERKRKLEEDKLNQQTAFDNRQLKLTEKYRADTLAQNESNARANKFIDFTNTFTPYDEKTMSGLPTTSGTDINANLGLNIDPIKMFVETGDLPKELKQNYLPYDQVGNKVFPRDPVTGATDFTKSLYEIPKEKSGNNNPVNNGKGFTTEWQVKALNDILRPVTTKKNEIGEVAPKTPEEMQTERDNNMTLVMQGVGVSPAGIAWFNKYGKDYDLSRLNDEIETALNANILSEKDAASLLDFLPTYEQIYKPSGKRTPKIL